MYRVNTPELPRICFVCGGFPLLGRLAPGSDFLAFL